MCTQTIPFYSQIINSPPAYRQKNLVFSVILKSWSCNLCKMVYRSRSISRTNYHSTVTCTGESSIKQEQCGDEYYIRRCVEIARTAVGCTSPNPMVGCVIVKDAKIIGEGFHPKAGQPHAEVFALRDAGESAENGTAYVSLEPCNHYGRTPPCTEALIKAKVKKVVVGMVDPNPIVASTGVKRLQEAGIEVIVGVEEALCKRLNEAYIHQMLTGRPMVTLRYSMSLNGNLLDKLGENSLNKGGYYSKLLQEYDAVVISSAMLAENIFYPVSNEPGVNQPHTIILSKSTNPTFQIPSLSPETASKVTIFSDKNPEECEISQEGFRRVLSDRLSLMDILEHCKLQGSCSVLLELMGAYVDFEDILREGVDRGLIQKVLVEILPVLGGSKMKPFDCIKLDSKIKNFMTRMSGESILLEGYF